MHQPFAEIENSQQRIEDKVQLSAAISDQFLDKKSFADNAVNHFADWDKSGDGALSLAELSSVQGSQEASYTDRATASLLAENFSLISSLSAIGLAPDPNLKSYSDAGLDSLLSVFGNDFLTDGITRKDLTALSMFTSPSGEQKFLNHVQAAEKNSLAFNGLLTGINGTLALLNLASMFGPAPIRFFNAAIFGINTVGTVVSGKATLDAVGKNDMQLMEMQFRSRKAMLNSLEEPRL
jgi:hypothetical protein